MTFTVNIYLVCFVFICVTVPCVDALLRKYLSLITDVHDHYKTSSVCFIMPRKDKHSDEYGSAYLLSRELSRKGILTLVINSEETIKLDVKQNRPEVPPLRVVPLTTVDDIDNIRKNIRVNGSSSIWLVIFAGEFDHRICEYCKEPMKNIFHLRFDTEMLVLCCQDPLLKEWWSVRENYMKTMVFGKWTTKDGLQLSTNESLYARRPRIDGTELRIGIVTNSAFYIDEGGKPGGFFSGILMELQRVMNFRVSAIIKEDGFGSWDMMTKSWSGAIGLINKGEVDVGVAEFSMTNRRRDVVDFTLPLVLSETQLYFKQSDDSGVLWSAYFRAFTFQIWLMIILLLIGSALLITLMKMRPGVTSFTQLIVEHYLYVWGIFCQQGLDVFPVETSLRIAYFSIFTTALVISAAYSASLISFITVSSVTLPFTTLAEFADDTSYGLIVLQNSSDWDLFISPSDPVLTRMKGQLRPWENLPRNMEEGFKQVCREKVAFFTSQSMVTTSKKYFPCEVSQIDTGSIDTFAMILPAGSQYTGAINYHIQRFQDTGIVNRLRDKYLIKPIEPETTHNEVTLWGVAPILSVLAGGIIVALVILLCEKFYKRISTRQRKCRRINFANVRSKSAKMYRWFSKREKPTATHQQSRTKLGADKFNNSPMQYYP